MNKPKNNSIYQSKSNRRCIKISLPYPFFGMTLDNLIFYIANDLEKPTVSGIFTN